MTGPVLVTDGEQRATLAVVRSLGRAGRTVLVGAGRRHSLAGASRYAAETLVLPDPLADAAGFRAALLAEVSRRGVGILLPMTEASLLAVLTDPDAFRPARIPFADLDRFRRISDKAELLRLAPEVGIAVPAQHRCETPEALAMILDRLVFPVVIKPARSVVETAGGRDKVGVSHAADPGELVARAAEYPAGAYPLLLQQRIVGPGIGVFLLPWRGTVRAQFAHRRIREKPPAGGVSVYRESVALDPGLLERSQALLERFGWEGVAMIEYKVDAATGTPYLMEINGRFWGSLQLAIDAGVDFPRILCELAEGRDPAPVASYRTGIRDRWWWGDVDHLLARMRRSATELALPPGAPGRVRALLDFLTLWRPGDRNEIFRWSDPWPLVQETFDWVRGR